MLNILLFRNILSLIEASVNLFRDATIVSRFITQKPVGILPIGCMPCKKVAARSTGRIILVNKLLNLVILALL